MGSRSGFGVEVGIVFGVRGRGRVRDFGVGVAFGISGSGSRSGFRSRGRVRDFGVEVGIAFAAEDTGGTR
jgi:hypothetical protein